MNGSTCRNIVSLLVMSLLATAVSLFAQENDTTIALPGGETMEMVWIDPGKFMMGSPSSDYNGFIYDGPQHEVIISQGFYLGKYELTQGQWEAVMNTTPWVAQMEVVSDPHHPAVWISWDDVQEFVRRLNESEGAEVYRMPTEAEWEYACRAGTVTKWSFGDDKRILKSYAWYDDNAWEKKERYAHAVGGKLPNPWGLYDMHGNVGEWVQDWVQEKYLEESQVDPVGAERGNFRGKRGGSFKYGSWGTRSTARGMGKQKGPVGQQDSTTGVRLLRVRR